MLISKKEFTVKWCKLHKNPHIALATAHVTLRIKSPSSSILLGGVWQVWVMLTLKGASTSEVNKGFFFFVCTIVSTLVETAHQISLPSAEQRIASALDLQENPGCAWLPSPQGHTAGFTLFFHSNTVQSFQGHFPAITLEEDQLKPALTKVHFWGVSFTQVD